MNQFRIVAVLSEDTVTAYVDTHSQNGFRTRHIQLNLIHYIIQTKTHKQSVKNYTQRARIPFINQT